MAVRSTPHQTSRAAGRATGPLARRLLLVLLPLVMGPLLAAAPFLFQLAERDITGQIVEQLTVLSVSKEAQIDQWAAARANDINNLADSPDVAEAARAFVLEPAGAGMAAGGEALQRRLERFITQNPDYESLLLVHARTGEVLLATSAHEHLVGQSPLDPAVLSASRQGPRVAPVRHYPQFAPEWIRLLVLAPVLDSRQGPVALVVGVIPGGRLADIAAAGLGQGAATRAYLVAGDGYMVAEAIQPQAPRPDSQGIRQALAARADGNGVYPDPSGEYVVGVYNWLPGFDMALLVEENENVAFASLTRFSQIFAAIAAVAALVGAAGVLLFTRGLTRPIQELTEGARRMAAGDLAWRVPLERRDEIGELASALNTMAARLRNSLESLEQRVTERTVELAQASEHMRYRAAQLRTVAEVAHAAASEQDRARLLPLVAELISDRFRFYHVGIFLLDEAGEFAVLQAANSEGGRRMLARGHKLRVGQTGIVGHVANRGQPRIAVDVGMDAVFFDNPDLPLTRSEMAVPLKVRGRVIGVLDVQSQQAAAFTEDDAGLLGILSDQVAIAIDNARLFAETRQALDEVQSVHRQYLRQEWGRLAVERGRPGSGFRYSGDGSVAPAALDLPEADQALETGELVVYAVGASGREPAEAGRAAAAVPIKLRGQVIGVIDLVRSGAGEVPDWSDDELTLAQAVADQVGLALENARLLEETLRRVQRERTVAEVTDHLYRASDTRSVLQIAAEELRRITGSARAVVRLSHEAGPRG
jgi:GAF domain-containing protein